jgi:O-antigen/teichoic acid export membrane protein
MVSLFLLLRFLIPQYGIYGAAMGTTTTIVIFNAVKTYFVWRKLKILPFSGRTLLVIVAALPAIAAGVGLPHFFSNTSHVYVNALLDVSVRSLVIVVAYVLMLLWLKPSPDLESYLASVKKNKRLF